MDQHDVSNKPAMAVGALLRTALQLLESDGSSAAYGDETSPSTDSGHFEPPHDTPARKEWLEAQQENRCIQVTGNAMAPILADGACVAYSEYDEDPRQSRRQDGGGMAREPAHNSLVQPLWPVRAAAGRKPGNGPAATTHRLRGCQREAAHAARALDRYGSLINWWVRQGYHQLRLSPRQGKTSTLPSPIRPVRAWPTIALMTAGACSSSTKTVN